MEMGAKEPAPVISRGSTVTEQVYELLRSRITSGLYPGGTHLVERQLAAELQVSKTPVRESLTRLEKEGLVECEPGRGMRVRSLEPAEVLDMLELREVLEGFAAEKAAGLVSAKELADLESIIDSSEHLELTDVGTYKKLDEAFHRALWRASRNRRVQDLMTLLLDQIRMVMTTTMGLPGRRIDSPIEHRRILTALKAGDSDAAGTHARAHIRNARTALREHGAAGAMAPKLEQQE